jgi:hypothetical protein
MIRPIGIGPKARAALQRGRISPERPSVADGAISYRKRWRFRIFDGKIGNPRRVGMAATATHPRAGLKPVASTRLSDDPTSFSDFLTMFWEHLRLKTKGNGGRVCYRCDCRDHALKL